MTKKLLLIAAIGLGLGLSLASTAVSCEMHKSHAATAAPPAKVEPVVLPQSKIIDEAAISVAPEVSTSPYAKSGCRRNQQTTVYLTQ